MQETSFLDRLLQQFRSLFNPAAMGEGGNLPLVILVAAGLLALWLAWRVVRRLFGRGHPGPAQEAGIPEEDLGSYPPPPPGDKRLIVEGRPTRLRLVVVAPVGKDKAIDVSQVETMLDQVLYGLGDLVRQDKPRILVWPAQLSNKGFAFTFNRLVRRPEPPGQPSPWILVAGQTPARPRAFMLGLAVRADEPNYVGHLFVPPAQWPVLLRV